MNAVLEVDHLTVAYHHRPVLRAVSFSCQPGTLVGVVGPNGAGKSTLFKAILGLVPLAAGSVRVFGGPVERHRQRVAYVPQKEMLDWDFPATVRDVIRMGRVAHVGWLRRPTRTDHERVEAALAEVGMAELAERPIGQLSGGQQQRVVLARALAQEAELLLLDEPFVGVDAATEDLIFQIMERLRDAGKTILVVNHDLSAVERYDLLVLINGRLIACGLPQEVFTPDNLRATYAGRLALLDRVEFHRQPARRSPPSRPRGEPRSPRGEAGETP